MRKLAKHLPHYLSLFGIFVAGVLGFYFFAYDRTFQVIVAIAVAVSYVVWGIVHHLIHKDLYPEVIVEYIAVASLGLVVLFSLIFRA